ncbi:outer membrane beta-barrel protein [Devosia sp.]|uniref:outer membrane beta-barrel protein n=1 Tax=Devosia sp. TaxID=1871048 RepID=UPI003A90EC9E
MKRYLFALPFVLALNVFSAYAGDLPVEAAPLPAANAGGAIYVQILGGVVAGGDMSFYEPAERSYDMQTGPALAVALGYELTDGIAVEADVLLSKRVYVNFPDDDQTNSSLMANLKGHIELGDSVGVYGAVGAGYILSTNNQVGGYSFDYASFGYQLIGGVSFEIAEGVELLAEGRYQGSFGHLPSVDYEENMVEGQTTTGLVGVKFGF